MEQENNQPVILPEAPVYSVPWKPIDNWIGVGLLALIQGVIAVIMRNARAEIVQSAGIVLLELVYLLPVICIFAWRHVNWKSIGFGNFKWETMAIGCGLLIVAYAIILVHNALLFFLKVDTQGNQIVELFSKLKSPFWFFLVGAVVAPLVEEIFFRGFLFQGFRQKYGWVNGMLLSSAIFAAAHLDLVALIPTFILGNLLAYLYHRSNSVWPGILVHFLVNAFALSVAYFVVHNPSLFPM
jgi:membrane protease YdiL (CAAX protease family)